MRRIKKKATFFMSLVLMFAVLPTTIFAETRLETKEASEIYDVRLFEENKGKFNSYDEVLDSFGLKESNSPRGDVSEAIVVNSEDELAALLATMNIPSEEDSQIGTRLIQPYGKVIYDAKTWWVKAFVDATINNRRITGVHPYSQHLGVTFGSQWDPAEPIVDDIINTTAYSKFTVKFPGTVSLNLIIDGFVKFLTTSVNGYVSETYYH